MTAKVLIVIGSLDYGGAERHVVQMVPRLARLGWQMAVFTLREPGAQASILTGQGIPVRAPKLRSNPKRGPGHRVLRLAAASAALLSCLRHHRPDIVHFFLPQAYLAGAPCALLLGYRRLVMSRRSRNLYQQRHAFAAGLERWLHRRMAAVLGNSHAVIDDLRAEGVDEKRLGLIYNGVDPTGFQAAENARAKCRRDLGIPDGALVLIKVANLIPYKGHADLIDAAAAARLPDPWRILCVGRDQGVLNELRVRAAEAGLTDNFIWTGPRVDIADLLAAADIGLLCSHEEGFSNAILEYMSAGLPVVATDVGGNAEAVRDGVTGFIVPAHAPAAMARAIKSLLDPERRTAMGAAGRERLLSRFAIEQCEAGYDALYRSLMRGGGVPRDIAVDRDRRTDEVLRETVDASMSAA